MNALGMSDAELTIRHSIMLALMDSRESFVDPHNLVSLILKEVFEPTKVWAVIDYTKETGA